jgi:hypothetical protein
MKIELQTIRALLAFSSMSSREPANFLAGISCCRFSPRSGDVLGISTWAGAVGRFNSETRDWSSLLHFPAPSLRSI